MASNKGSESGSGTGTRSKTSGRRQRQLQRQRWQKQHGSPILALMRAATATAGEARPPNYRAPSLVSPSTFGADAGPQLRSAQTQGRSCRLCYAELVSGNACLGLRWMAMQDQLKSKRRTWE